VPGAWGKKRSGAVTVVEAGAATAGAWAKAAVADPAAVSAVLVKSAAQSRPAKVVRNIDFPPMKSLESAPSAKAGLVRKMPWESLIFNFVIFFCVNAEECRIVK